MLASIAIMRGRHKISTQNAWLVWVSLEQKQAMVIGQRLEHVWRCKSTRHRRRLATIVARGHFGFEFRLRSRCSLGFRFRLRLRLAVGAKAGRESPAQGTRVHVLEVHNARL